MCIRDRLNHPNVTTIFDHGVLDEVSIGSDKSLLGCPWLAMEEVTGGTIRRFAGKASWSHVQSILLDVLRALAHAHAKGMIHRDIKPGNILVDQTTGQIKLTDFGLAQSLSAMQNLSPRAEFMTGTPSYMAPEQIRGHRRAQGPWSDIYSVGALGWTLLTGRPPYCGSLEEVLLAHLKGNLRAFLPAVDAPPEVEGWLRRTMQTNPAHRFFSAADAAWALTKLPTRVGSSQTPRAQSDEAIWAEDTIQLHDTSRTQPVDVWTDATTSPGIIARPEAHQDRPPFPKSWRRDWVPRRHLHGAGLALFGLRTNALVGREHERDVLWQELHQCVSDKTSRLVVVEGPEGVGKSTLIRWMSERAYELGQAQTITFSEADNDSAIDRLGAALSRQLRLDGLTRSEAVTTVNATLQQLDVDDEQAAMALVQLARPNAEAPADSGLIVHFATLRERITLLAWYLSKLAARRPLIVIADDLDDDIAARETIQLLLDRRVGSILCLTTVQFGESDDDNGAAAVAELRQHKRAVSLSLEALTGSDRTALLRELLGLDPALASRMESETGGNPQFAVQLVGHWIAEGRLVPGEHGFKLRYDTNVRAPTTMMDLWTARLEALSTDASDESMFALELAATFGDVVPQPSWKQALRVANLSLPTELVEDMARLRLIVEDSETKTIRFAHPMFRAAILRRSERAGREKRWASLAADTLTQERRTVRLRAELLAKAGRLNEALAPLASAIEVEIDTGTRGGAQALHALREQIIEKLSLDPRSHERFRSAVLEGRMMSSRSARMAHLQRHFDQLFSWASELRDMDAQAQLLRIFGYSHIDNGQTREGAKLIEQALAIASTHETASLPLVLYAKAGSDLRMGKHADAIATTQEMLRVSRDRGDAFREGQARYNLYEIYFQGGDLDSAESNLQEARRAYGSIGARKGIAQVALADGELARAKGDYEQAIRAYTEAKMRGENCENTVALDAQINLGLVCVEVGRTGEARHAFEDILRVQGANLLVYTRTVIRLGLVNCLIAESNWQKAKRELSELDTVLLKSRIIDRDYATMATLAARRAAAMDQHGLARRAWEIAEDQWSLLGNAEKHAEAQSALVTLI